MNSRAAYLPMSTGTFTQFRKRSITVCALALWAMTLIGICVHLPATLVETLVVGAIALTLPDISAALRVPLFLCAAVLTVLVVVRGDATALRSGLDFAAPLAGFLVAVGVLRAALTGGAHGAIAHSRLSALPQSSQRSSILLLSFVLSAVFLVGVFFVLSAVFLVGVFPLLAPLTETRDRIGAERIAAASLSGGALAYLWSPSVTSGTLTVVASSFGVPLRPLVMGRNLLFIVGLGAVIAVVAAVAS